MSEERKRVAAGIDKKMQEDYVEMFLAIFRIGIVKE